MKTSGLFTAHEFNIPATYGKESRIIVFGDVHRDSPNHADERWKEDLAYWKQQEDCYFLGMGDYLDSTSTSERECLGNINKAMHDTFRKDIELLQEAKVDLIANEIKFMKDRLIGLVNGNHYYNFSSNKLSGLNSDQLLAQKLNCKYLGVCSLIRVTFQFSKNGDRYPIDFFVHHGMGAARLIGGSLNRVAQMFEGVEADIAIMGHDHKRGAVPTTPRLFLRNHPSSGLQVMQRETWAIRSGSYLTNFRPNEVNYNVDSCRPPSSLGHVEIRIKFTKKETKVNGKRKADVQKIIRCLS